MTQSPPSLPLLYLEKAGSVEKHAAARVSHQDESRGILTKRRLATKD